MGFKAATKPAPPASRNRAVDPAMVNLVDELLTGKIPAIVTTGDDKAKGKAKEKSARAEASKVAHYIRTKHESAGKVRTIWVADETSVYVTLAKNSENGDGENASTEEGTEDDGTDDGDEGTEEGTEVTEENAA